MSIEELQLVSSIAGDVTTITLVVVAIVWTEKRRIALSDRIIDDWHDLKEMFKDMLKKT